MQEFFLDYCLTQELSHKKSRRTYLAHARQDAQQKLVIKIFDPDCVNPEQKQEQGALLADILLSLKHPHIIPILDIAIKQGRPYIVSEYRSHGSLEQRLSPERMDWSEAVRIVIQLGQALCYAHEHGIVHGNLKPENVFYYVDGEVQLTDFSLTPFIDVAKLDYKSDLSTICYMAPEQFMGKTDQRSDQYSLACLAYELITGKPPFNAADSSSLGGKHATEYAAPLASAVPEVPMSIDLAVLKALAKKPHERYEDVAAFVTALERGLSIQAAEDEDASVANPADDLLLSNPFWQNCRPRQRTMQCRCRGYLTNSVALLQRTRWLHPHCLQCRKMVRKSTCLSLCRLQSPPLPGTSNTGMRHCGRMRRRPIRYVLTWVRPMLVMRTSRLSMEPSNMPQMRQSRAREQAYGKRRWLTRQCLNLKPGCHSRAHVKRLRCGG